MNERIQELKQQAADYVDSIDNGIGIEEYRKLLDQKFAELIVRECAKIADDGCGSACFGLGINGAMLKEHFGFTE